MRAADWQAFIMRAVEEYAAGNPENSQRIARHLEVCDDAKQVLRDRGSGWTGLDILETARMVTDCATGGTLEAVLTVADIRVAEYQIVARDSISDLELMVNQMIGYGWQPYGTPITTHGFWYQPMVKHATSGTGGGE